MMKRIKSIDTFRGLCMIWLVTAHIIPQWLNNSGYLLYDFLWNITDSIGACAFLFLSGISSFIAFKKRESNTRENAFSMKNARNEYYFRALIIFLIGFIVNLILAIYNNMWWWIFAWDFLQVISISLILAWPLFKRSNLVRIAIAIAFWVVNEIILFFIRPSLGEEPSLVFMLLYTTEQLDSILWFFSFFIIGTVIGDLIFKYLLIENNASKKKYLKNNILIPCIIISIILICLGYLLEFPDLFSSQGWAHIRSLPWRIYALGVDIFLISLLIFIEEYELIKFKKNYRFLFYFSYYSFTVYASHYLLTLIFLNLFNVDLTFWFFLIMTMILYGLLLNVLYKKLGPKVSIKIQISRLSSFLANYIDKRKNRVMRL